MNNSEIKLLINSIGNDIYNFCYKLTLNKEDAEELYQDSFLKFFELKEKISSSQNPKSYLISIVINIWKNKSKVKVNRKRIATFIDFSYYENTLIDANSNIEEIMIKKELHHNLNIIISNLNPKFKLPVLMFYNLNFSIEEISTILKIPKGTVKSRLYKGKFLIKKELEAMKIE